MQPPPQSRDSRPPIRFDGSPELLLLAMACGTPLHVHASNWMAGLCAMVPLREMVADHTGTYVFFPEDGLHDSLENIDAIHGIDLDTGTGPVLSVEFAIQGDPRALAFAAIPNLSDADRFRSRIKNQRITILEGVAYQRWNDGFTQHPAMCPCCAETAEKRRAAPQHNPLTRIFRHAIHHSIPLRSGIISPTYGFTTWLTPGEIGFDDGRIELTGTDRTTMLEFDPGACHSLSITRRCLDGERFTMMKLYDSFGNPCLEIGTPGWEAEPVWCGFCAMNPAS